jgi:two-component system, LytTR family, response regulator
MTIFAPDSAPMSPPVSSLSVLIVDDEPLAREGLRMLLVEDPDIGAVHLARTGREAVTAIRELAPSLVLLDVQMPELDGFGVIAAVGAAQMPAVVFVTAHDQYAIAAFEISAVDYLLKPVTAVRFAQAMARAKARLRAASVEERARQAASLRELREAMPPSSSSSQSSQSSSSPSSPSSPSGARRGPERIAVRAGERIRFVAVEEIEWFQGAENYVELHLGESPDVHLLQVTMNALERTLDPARFLRVHRSAIVQLARIVELRPLAHGEYQITLTSGAKVRTGRTYHERVRELLRNPF